MLSDELQLALILRSHGMNLFNGVTQWHDRKEKARAGIKQFAIEEEKHGRYTAKQWFIKSYGEEL